MWEGDGGDDDAGRVMVMMVMILRMVMYHRTFKI